MKRPLIVLAVILAASAAQAQTRAPVGSATMPRDVQSDSLGPRSEPTPTAAAAATRVQIEQSGYTSVRGLKRAADGTWQAVARDAKNAPVSLVVDAQGKVSQTR
ncbi:MAG: hypothetical protein FJX11_23455 [Alphaproteobacteria bacterium]|nr:hypothetical protein [Alphaproteobacteria bacterium]